MRCALPLASRGLVRLCGCGLCALSSMFRVVAPLACVACAAQADTSAIVAEPPGCGVRDGALSAQEFAARSSACRASIAPLLGRAVQIAGAGSASIWTQRTPAGTALVTTAAHVSTPCDEEDSVQPCIEGLQIPSVGRAELRLTTAEGEYASRWSAMFPLFNVARTLDERRDPASILPAHDMAVFVVDGQTFEPWDRGRIADITHTSPSIFDPHGTSVANPSFADPVAGEELLLLGYPILSGVQPDLYASTIRVYADEEARATLAELGRLGDEEGAVPYDPTVEFVAQGQALRGMSGAGAYNSVGQQVGILVRGTEAGHVPIVRIVRLRYLAERLETAVQSVPLRVVEGTRAYLAAP